MSNKREKLKKLLVMTFGCFLYAAGVSLFLDPCSLAPGGVSGIAIIINKFFDFLPTGTWVAILNVPIFLLGVWKLGFKFILPTVYAVAVSAVMMNVISYFIDSLTDNLLLAAVFGGALVAVGIGLVFRAGGTTGGTDIIVKVLKKFLRHMNTGLVFFMVDGAVVLTSAVVFRDVELALYAAISVMITSFLMNKVLYGTEGARMVYIISGKKDEIASRLMKDLDSGVTVIHATGAYTGSARDILMCVVRAKTLPHARDVVKDEDKNAFMIVTSATGVFGEGFSPHDAEEL